MTLAANDIEQIRRHLGYPVDPQYQQQIITRVAVVNAYPETVQTVRRILRELGRIEQERRSSRPFADRTLTSNASGTSQRSPSFGADHYQQTIRQYIDELAHTLGLSVMRYPQASGWQSSGRISRA